MGLKMLESSVAPTAGVKQRVASSNGPEVDKDRTEVPRYLEDALVCVAELRRESLRVSCLL